ncbi:hypothetical protein [Salinibacter grassmerensis]|uniref:hypothetical protein n=1 Tax=Salinibacter grassmerensis TaxID=3040353 RepID=UPI0021E930A9|nr:hypothetical protein [Salinibacter grassmerensis]
MPTGHFAIGDLSFSFEGSLEELAHCQEIVREIERAEHRLRRASGAEEVVVIYDQDLEGERGTFDKMRLRAYDDEHNYTLDLGVTDTNPLGIYVGYDQNIEVYNRDTGETWQITPEGDPVKSDEDGSGADPREEPTARDADTSRRPSSSSTRSTEPASSEGPSQAEIDRAAEVLVNRVRQQPPEQRVGDTTIPDGPLGEKLIGFATYCGRGEGYLNRVLDVKSVSAVDALTVGQVPDVLAMIKDEETLRQNESFEPDNDLPF